MPVNGGMVIVTCRFWCQQILRYHTSCLHPLMQCMMDNGGNTRLVCSMYSRQLEIAYSKKKVEMAIKIYFCWPKKHPGHALHGNSEIYHGMRKWPIALIKPVQVGQVRHIPSLILDAIPNIYHNRPLPYLWKCNKGSF